jgi:hypothetical protein
MIKTGEIYIFYIDLKKKVAHAWGPNSDFSHTNCTAMALILFPGATARRHIINRKLITDE